MLINILNEVKNKMNTYYKINEDINNYDNQKINFEILYYLNQFQSSNLYGELKQVIKSNSIKDKFNYIFNIYRKMNIDEITIIYKVKDKKEVKLFGDNFVKGNKKNCKLIIEGKEQELKEMHSLGIFFGTDKDYFEIKLKGITNITKMNKMFHSCNLLSSLPDIWKWNTSNVTNMTNIFYECSSLSSLPDIWKWNTSYVFNMSYMFYECSSLSSLSDISKWDTSNVMSMNGIFSGCNSLLSIPDISKWNTSNVTDMGGMFSECERIISIPDISKWETSKVTNMSYMFSRCKSLSSLPDISKWNTSNVSDMDCMFFGCKNSLNIPSKYK